MGLEEIRPTKRELVMDLVSQAGLDVSDWARFKGGAERAATNPKYCYEWSFVDTENAIVVLNLWFDDMEEHGAVVTETLNMRERAREIAQRTDKGVWERRAINMDIAIQTAFRGGWPVRVIVLAGGRRNLEDAEPKASKVQHRMLDPEPWSVAAYDWHTGQATLVRRGAARPYVDQFSLPGHERKVEYRDVGGRVAVRSAAVREHALLRADGRCEWCNEPGFLTDDGSRYLETHHVLPLSEGGPDTIENVIALCPNHHREAHFGTDRADLRAELHRHILAAEKNGDT
jgi:hypothetical protein